MRRLVLILTLTISLTACKKDKSWEHWDKLANQKHKEIISLTANYSCNDVENLTLQKENGFCSSYYLVHTKDIEKFNRLLKEYKELNTKASNAGKPIPYYDMCLENPPLRTSCIDGKAKLIYTHDLTIEEVNLEIPPLLTAIKNFYADVPCTDPNNWTGHILRTNCCIEPIAIHKTIKRNEILTKVELYNRLMERKRGLEKTDCSKTNCPQRSKPIQCIDGKPVIEMY